MDEYRGTGMERLSNISDFEVADDSPDVRGWDVASSDGRTIGKVDDLIVDTAAMKARYLLIDLKKDAVTSAAGDSDRHVLVPLGRARVEESDKRVRLDVASTGLSTLPRFSGTVAAGYDEDYHRAAPAPAGTARDATTARDTEHDTAEGRRMTRSAEELRIGRRQVKAGEVQVHKTVETEHVSQPVERKREDVRVERRPVSGSGQRAEIREDEIRVPITEEELVVEKRPVVKEELVIGKETKTEKQNVEADLRKERVDVERTGRHSDDHPDTRRR